HVHARQAGPIADDLALVEDVAQPDHGAIDFAAGVDRLRPADRPDRVFLWPADLIGVHGAAVLARRLAARLGQPRHPEGGRDHDGGDDQQAERFESAVHHLLLIATLRWWRGS